MALVGTWISHKLADIRVDSFGIILLCSLGRESEDWHFLTTVGYPLCVRSLLTGSVIIGMHAQKFNTVYVDLVANCEKEQSSYKSTSNMIVEQNNFSLRTNSAGRIVEI